MRKPKFKTVPVRKCSIIAMCDGRGERTHPIVIDKGYVKRYVGIGWVTERRATFADLRKYPTVVRES